MKASPGNCKFTPPRLPRIVERPRLNRRLEKRQGKRVILVSGQAAQGKSTLVAAYLNRCGARTAWLHLDREDSDHVNLYYLLVHALQFAFPRLDLSGYLEHPHMTLGSMKGSLRYSQRLPSLFSALPSPVQIVLDGLDNLRSDAPAFQLIEAMATHVPDRSAIYLITRIDPPLNLERLRIQQAMLTLSNADLAFTREEIRRFFRLTLNLELTGEQIEQIDTITEGWTGGLVLIAEALHRLPEKTRPGYIAEHLPADMHQETLAFFSREIFDAQPESIRSFLVTSSVLDVIDPEILELLMDTTPVRAHIRELVRRNLFIQSIYDPERGWTYRYNQLFRAFLQSMFTSGDDARPCRKLRKAAAAFYWEKGHIETAIRYYLKAEAYAEAAAGIKKIGTDLAICGRYADLTRFVYALPPQMIRRDPWLLYLRSLTRKIGGGTRNIDDLKKCLDMFETYGDTRGSLLALAFLIETLVFFGAPPSQVQQWTQTAENRLRHLRGKPYFAYAKTVLWLQIGFGQITGGNLQKGLSACQNAYLMARRIQDVTLQINATIVSVLGLSLAGEFRRADAALEKAGHLIGGSDSPEYRTLQHIVKIDLALNKGDLDRAGRLIERTQEDIETFGLLFLYPAVIDASGLFHIYRQAFGAAEKVRKHLSDVAVLASNRHYEGLSLRLAGMLQYHGGNYPKARAFADRAEACLTEAGTESLHILQVTALKGMIHLHLAEKKAAETELEKALAYFDKTGNAIASAECHLALALVKNARGRTAAARTDLTEGLQIAAAMGYEHMPILRPLDFLEACMLAVEWELGPEADYAARLIAARLTETHGQKIGNLPSANDQRGRPKAVIAVKRMIYRTRVPMLDIRTFAGFRVLKGDHAPIRDAEWAGKRPKTLLKAILVHGARDIPKDILIDTLWPDSRPESAQKNLKVTLHRLRHILEPTMNRQFGSSYIHLKNNLVSLDRDLCRVDVEEFLGLFKKINQQWDTGRSDDLLSLCQQAENLYRGDFLPEEPYLSWAELKRNMLRENYLTVLGKMAGIYKARGDLERAAHYYRLISRTDPFQEQAHQYLMQIYSALGRKSAAVKVYENFRSFIRAEIGESPDRSTTALYRKILANG